MLARILASIFFGGVVLGGLSWFYPESVLTVDSGEVKADVIVVLGGAWLERPQRALELFRQQAAPKILITGISEGEVDRHFFETNGVPSSAIMVEGLSRSTRENAKFSIALLRDMGARRVIIVTSWYHSRRGLRCFEHYAADIQFYSRPSYLGYPRADANRKSIQGYIRAEYVKLAGYWICYGVCPW